MTVAFITGRIPHKKKVVCGSVPAKTTQLVVNYNYKCYYCAFSFPDEGGRLDHVRKVHDTDNIAYSEFGPK